MNLERLLEKIRSQPDQVGFDEVIAVIDSNYQFRETAFRNGGLENRAGENNGSCRIFAFAQLHQLTPEQTLHCFGDYYRKDVLANPAGSDHQNIRNFVQSGWDAVHFQGEPLRAK